MNAEQVKQILDKIKDVKVAVYGDFCLDAYWILDSKGGEMSVETGLQAQAISKHYYTLGGASNVVANIAASTTFTVEIDGTSDELFGRSALIIKIFFILLK